MSVVAQLPACTHAQLPPLIGEQVYGGRVLLSMVNLGVPAAPDAHTALQTRDVTIYIDKRLAAESQDTLAIGLSGLWGWRELGVEGAQCKI